MTLTWQHEGLHSVLGSIVDNLGEEAVELDILQGLPGVGEGSHLPDQKVHPAMPHRHSPGALMKPSTKQF